MGRSPRSNYSHSSSISTSSVEALIQKIKGDKYRQSTKATYLRIWKCFNQFFIRLDRKPEFWEDRITLFVGYLISEKKKSSTIKSYVSAIKAVLHDNDIEVHEDTYLINSLTKACRLHQDRVSLRFTIQKGLLEIILKYTKNWFMSQGQVYNAHLYAAMFTTAYFGLFRIGELKASPHTVKACDVQIGDNKNKVLFILRSSKTHNRGDPPQLIKIGSTASTFSSNEYCPFNLLRNYLACQKEARSYEENFFVFRDRSPVHPRHFRKVLKTVLSLAGFDSRPFSGHSFRGGRALDLLELGLSVETIKKMGRWRSNAVYNYLK